MSVCVPQPLIKGVEATPRRQLQLELQLAPHTVDGSRCHCGNFPAQKKTLCVAQKNAEKLFIFCLIVLDFNLAMRLATYGRVCQPFQ